MKVKKVDSNKVNPTVESGGDKAHRVARAALSSIPVVGGAAVEIFNAIIAPPLERRKAEWMNQVTEAINQLIEKGGLTPEELQNNEQFFTTLVQASQTALRNHQKEKLEALKNAILNAALPNAPDESLQQMFLNFVDTFTVWHLRLLNLFHAPVRQKAVFSGALSHVVEDAFPELRGRRGFYDQVWRDLYTRGLVNTESLHGLMSADGLTDRRTSDLGGQFLSFIMNPAI